MHQCKNDVICYNHLIMSNKLKGHGLKSSKELGEMVGDQTAIPVLTITNIEDAVPLAEALVAGGLSVIEVAMRTDLALEAVRLIKKNVSGAKVGVGTVLLPEHFKEAKEAGAMFAVSPGSTPSLIQAAEESGLPWLPGVLTPSESMTLWERGYDKFKLFPCYDKEQYIEQVAKPIPFFQYCPTGGVNRDNAESWLKLPGVWCTGGAWVIHQAAANKEWDQVEKYAREVADLRKN